MPNPDMKWSEKFPSKFLFLEKHAAPNMAIMTTRSERKMTHCNTPNTPTYTHMSNTLVLDFDAISVTAPAGKIKS